jgi:tRNA pseudouridine38-40 synthase
MEVAYQGTHYHGWQIQENAHSIQAEIQNKISILLKTDTEVIASGRTDTGVHAEQQMTHFDSPVELNPDDFLYKINSILPKDIACKTLFKMPDEAHARFDAILRTYQYRISRQKNPFLKDLCWVHTRLYDRALMNQAASLLLNYSDFECFSKVKTSVNHFICHIKKAEWMEHGDMLIFEISANRFLRGMVRAIVGTLLDVGANKMNLNDFQKVIESGDRKKAGSAVPAQGLFLTKVEYERF